MLYRKKISEDKTKEKAMLQVKFYKVKEPIEKKKQKEGQ